MGTATSGKLVLLQLGSGVSATSIATARTNSFTINHTVVDTTTKKDGGFGSILAGGGTTSITISLEGVFNDETYDNTLRGYGFNGSSNEYTIIMGNGDKIVGKFIITSYTVGGAYNEAETFSATLQNDGIVTFTAGA
jgi:TP901-1 family phage major tail protein